MSPVLFFYWCALFYHDRWDISKPASASNLILLKFTEVFILFIVLQVNFNMLLVVCFEKLIHVTGLYQYALYFIRSLSQWHPWWTYCFICKGFVGYLDLQLLCLKGVTLQLIMDGLTSNYHYKDFTLLKKLSFFKGEI